VKAEVATENLQCHASIAYRSADVNIVTHLGVLAQQSVTRWHLAQHGDANI
jgi:hypothetical protein